MFEISTDKFELTLKEECEILQHGAGIHPIPDSTVIILKGKDTLDFINRVSTNSVIDSKPFQKITTLFLNEKGRFIDKATLLNLDDQFMLIGSPDNDHMLFNWINKFIIMEEIQTTNATDDFLVLEIFGPQANSYLTLLIGDEIKNLTENNVIYTHADGFKFHLYKDSEFGVQSYKIIIEKSSVDDFVNYMIQNKSVFDIGLIGDESYKIFRVEHGVPSAPNEINDNFNPHETNLIENVNFKKGCYIGQEVIARLDTYDRVQRIMKGVVFNDDCDLNEPIVLLDNNDDDAGIITSLVNSEIMKKQIGIALVRKKYANNSSQIVIKNGKNRIPVTLCDLPFKK